MIIKTKFDLDEKVITPLGNRPAEIIEISVHARNGNPIYTVNMEYPHPMRKEFCRVTTTFHESELEKIKP